MKRPCLIFDLDGTMIDTNPMLIEYAHFNWGVEIKPQQFIGGNSLEQLVNSLLPPEQRVTRDVFYRRLTQEFLCERRWQRRIQPMSGSSKALCAMSTVCDFKIATARPTDCKTIVNEILDRMFSDVVFREVHFVWRWNEELEVFEKGPSKRDYILSHQPEECFAFFDDDPGEVREVHHDFPTYLFDPFGHHRKTELDITNRLVSWDEITELVLSAF